MGKKADNVAAMNVAKGLNQQIRDAILKRIKDKGITQSKLADIMGKSRANVSILLTQANVMTIPTIVEFCRALDLGFDIILKEECDVSVKVSKSDTQLSTENEDVKDLSQYILRMKELSEEFLSSNFDCNRVDETNNCLDYKNSEAKISDDTEHETEIDIELDKYEEDNSQIVIESCTAYLTRPGEIEVIGEALTLSGGAINQYKEIRFNVYDDKGKLLGTNYINWSKFGQRRSFKEQVNYKPKTVTPSKVRVYPC